MVQACPGIRDPQLALNSVFRLRDSALKVNKSNFHRKSQNHLEREDIQTLMPSPSTRRSPRQSTTPSSARRLLRENAAIVPSPLRNEISASTGTSSKRKRARSLGGASNDDTTRQINNPRKKRMTIVSSPPLNS